MEQNPVEQLRETLHVSTQISKLVSRGTLLLIDPMAQLFELNFDLLRRSKLLTGGDLEIDCRDSFAGNVKIDDRGRYMN